MGNEGEKAEQMEPELPGKGCEKFPVFQGFFSFSLHWDVWKPSWKSKYYSTWVTHSCEEHWKSEIVSFRAEILVSAFSMF